MRVESTGTHKCIWGGSPQRLVWACEYRNCGCQAEHLRLDHKPLWVWDETLGVGEGWGGRSAVWTKEQSCHWVSINWPWVGSGCNEKYGLCPSKGSVSQVNSIRHSESRSLDCYLNTEPHIFPRALCNKFSWNKRESGLNGNEKLFCIGRGYGQRLQRFATNLLNEPGGLFRSFVFLGPKGQPRN